MLAAFAFATLLSTQTPPAAQDEVVATARNMGETAEALKLREALAYSNPLPRGAPTQDYPLVAWCDALVSGHVRLGESLTARAAEDDEIMRLGRLEAADFRSALQAGRARQTPATLAAAQAAAADATARWAPLLAQEDAAMRSQSFGLFFGLPGRCEHAARRVRANITTPPATPESVGLTVEGQDETQAAPGA